MKEVRSSQTERVNHHEVQRLKKEVREQRITIARLAAESDVSASMIKKMFSGVSSPTLRVYGKLASVVGITLVPQKKRKTA